MATGHIVPRSELKHSKWYYCPRRVDIWKIMAPNPPPQYRVKWAPTQIINVCVQGKTRSSHNHHKSLLTRLQNLLGSTLETTETDYQCNSTEQFRFVTWYCRKFAPFHLNCQSTLKNNHYTIIIQSLYNHYTVKIPILICKCLCWQTVTNRSRR